MLEQLVTILEIFEGTQKILFSIGAIIRENWCISKNCLVPKGTGSVSHPAAVFMKREEEELKNVLRSGTG